MFGGLYFGQGYFGQCSGEGEIPESSPLYVEGMDFTAQTNRLHYSTEQAGEGQRLHWTVRDEGV